MILLVVCASLLAVTCRCQQTTHSVPSTTGCPIGKYGPSCAGSCSANCYPANRCDGASGACTSCQAGWRGSNCTETCPEGTYGGNCAKNCSVNCGSLRTCSGVTGNCSPCKAGWHGIQCTIACVNTYGVNCKETCGSCKGGAYCNKQTGACPGCEPGYDPADNKCKRECSNNLWGQDCTNQCGRYCEVVPGRRCNKVNGICTCKPGSKPFLCVDECDNGTWGQLCRQNCSLYCTDVCRKSDGQCTCLPGYKPGVCTQKCTDNKYGQNCANSCGFCYGDTCHHVTGNCSRCQDNRKPPLCQECVPGQYGPSCGQRCGQCGGDGSCDPVSGVCLFTPCQPGWTGAKCFDKCAGGTFGSGCAWKCGHCRDNSFCRHDTGICEKDCQDDYTGVLCKTEKESLVAPIVGSVVGVGVLICIVIIGGVWFLIRRRSTNGPAIPKKDFMTNQDPEESMSSNPLHEEVRMSESRVYQNVDASASNYDRTTFDRQDSHSYAVHSPGQKTSDQESTNPYQNTGVVAGSAGQGPPRKTKGGALIHPEGTYGNVTVPRPPPPEATYGNVNSKDRPIYGNIQS